MARRRMIDPNIWQSEDFSKLSLLAKLLFIGMFSLSDDEGKGRAKPVYLKSVVFPYDDGMRLIDVEKALLEIGSNMSVTFYAHDGNDYYKMDNWRKWQRVEKPQPSQIPDPSTDNANHSGIIPELVENDSCLKEKKGKEEKEKGKEEKPKGSAAGKEKTHPPLPEDFPERFSLYLQEKIRDWLQYKAERKDFYLLTGQKKLLTKIENEVKKHGEASVGNVIDLSIERGWQGILWEKLEEEVKSYGYSSGNTSSSGTPPVQRRQIGKKL